MLALRALPIALLLACGCGDGIATGDPENVVASCEPIHSCDAAPPDVGAKASFRHTSSKVTSKLGTARHRGRDLIVTTDEPQWVIAKFAYGATDKDLEDEDVDVWLSRGCDESWENLGVATTTHDGQHDPVLGVEDTGGRIYFPIPDERRLEPGRHRILLSVRGDRTQTELFVEVIEPGAPVFISDVDGTLTTSEAVEFAALLIGALPKAHEDAAKALWALADAGYVPVYVTARPETLVQRTRDFLSVRGFPPGIIHTTQTLTGALGGSAATYKKGELQQLADRGIVPAYGFGNTASDAEAYDEAGVEHRYFYQFDDTVGGGRRIDSYGEIVSELSSVEEVCE